jgi:metal-dependent amidase/aminoacylase/carboxypeptidase family protein
MTESIVFPDAAYAAVTAIRDGLAAYAPTAVVGTRVPNPRPDTLVVVRRIGGARRNLVVDSATLSIEAWAATEEDAHDLAQYTRAVLHAARNTNQGGIAIYDIQEFAGPALLPDPDTESPRYVQTVEIGTRGLAA